MMTKPAPVSFGAPAGLENLAELARVGLDASSESIDRILALARSALDMDVALVTAFADDQAIVEAVDGEADSFSVEVGARVPLVKTYCRRMLKGRLPSVVRDAANDPRTADLSVTHEAQIGAYVGVPIRLWDGRLYGTLCCLSHEPEPTLNARDIRFMRVLAEIVAEQIDRQQLETEKRRLEWSRIRSILEDDEVNVEFQPVFDLSANRVVALEALARFWREPIRSPALWFSEAAEVGLGLDLELAAVEAALERIDEFPPDVSLAINVSPATAVDPRFHELVVAEASRLVIEITEHAQVDDYEQLAEALAPLRARGARVAIDDVGAGFASLRHILRLEPDIVKLDLTLTQSIARDPAREALASSLVHFAAGIDATIAAEGIESADDLALLRSLGVGYGQGFYLARPSSLLH
jgi:EAL domain-containing protein (putative c-di-GMP-specific phosphodiesterase class I)